MTTEQLWDLYQSAVQSGEDNERNETIYIACIKQDEDVELKGDALCHYGLTLCSRGTEESCKNGEKFLKLSAELQNEQGMIFYGRTLIDRGDMGGVKYIAGAVLKGFVPAGEFLKECYDSFKATSNTAGQETVKIAIDAIKDRALEDVATGCGGCGEICLATLGLYGLVDESEIDTKKAKEYIKAAAQKGNNMALEIMENPRVLDLGLSFEDEDELEDFDEEAFDREVDEMLKEEEQTQKTGDKKLLKKSLIIGAVGGLIVSNVLHINLVLSFIIVSVIAAIVLKKKM